MKRSFTFALLLIVCLALLVGRIAAQDAPTPEPVGLRPDAPEYALHGPYWVGVTESVVESPTHSGNLTIWYPADNPDGAAEETTYAFDYWPDAGSLPITGHALRDAAPDRSGAAYPLVLFVHGLGDSRLQCAWMCEHLASHGFVVAAMDQLDNWGRQDTEVEGIFGAGLVRRPQNVPWLIDYVAGLNAGEGPLSGLVDTDRVVVSGLSYGGYTALAAGGAQLNWEGLQTLCNEDRSNPALVSIMLGFNFCDVLLPAREPLADLAGVDANQAALWPVPSDRRVQAIVPMSPAFWPVMGPEGLQNVTVPMLIVGGSGDTLIPPTWDAFYNEVSSAQKAEVIFADANHLLAGPACSTMPWALDVGIFWACSDAVWDMDRAHDLINHFTTAFLLSTLKGDAEAMAALAPDAVAFPGIEYQAEGF